MSRALGRYELLRPLARGGMAEVYLARRKSAGVEKWLVVKRIRTERSTDVRFLDLFVREAKLSMNLTHQNIVPVFDFGRIDDQVFLAMERIEGRDLGSTLARGASHRVTSLAAAFIAAECLQALDYAHRRKSPDGAPLGIVHRDVTPRNILLSWDGEVKLTDFGIAALAGDATSSLVGTPAYMAPEQATGGPIDARADLYGLGLVLRELITGERARPGGERDATMAAAKANTLLPWPADAPPALVAIVDRATATSPADRYPDARAMLAELDGFMVGERAAHKVDAPGRQLAAWLDTVWGSEREDAGTSGDIEGNHLVSFLDDGALDVVGTGTERSMAATAGDEALPAPAPAPKPEAQLVVPSAPMPVRSIAKGTLLVVMLAILVGIGALFAITRATRGAATPDAAVAVATQTADAAIDATPDAAPEVSIDAAPEPVDAAPVPQRRDAGTKVRPQEIDAAVVPEQTPPPPVVLRKVTINATPWAYFTVDADPTQHETVKTIQLAPGKHEIHFSNPVLKVEKTITIDVPADRDISHVERLGG